MPKGWTCMCKHGTHMVIQYSCKSIENVILCVSDNLFWEALRYS